MGRIESAGRPAENALRDRAGNRVRVVFDAGPRRGRVLFETSVRVGEYRLGLLPGSHDDLSAPLLGGAPGGFHLLMDLGAGRASAAFELAKGVAGLLARRIGQRAGIAHRALARADDPKDGFEEELIEDQGQKQNDEDDPED
jgi:hypothetical protein